MYFIIFLFAYFCTFTGFSSYFEISPQEAARAAVRENLVMPEPYYDGRIQTLNKKGVMSPSLDEVSREFVQFAASSDVKVLEIGASYGNACIEALKLGCQNYHVNDMDIQHLKILARRIEILNEDYLPYIHLIPADFTKSINILENQYDAVLIASVFQFMKPCEVSQVLNQIYKILKPGGKIYSVMLSPYVKGFAPFIPEFEKRIKNHHPHPGYVNNLKDYVDDTIALEEHNNNVAKDFLFFNVEIAKNYHEQSGFMIEKLIEMPLAYSSRTWQLDGRENIGLIANKPL